MEGPIVFSIHEDLSGLPRARLAGAEFNEIEPLPNGSDLDLTYSSEGIPLAENNTYWLVASSEFPSVGGQSHGWEWTRSPIIESDFGWSIPPGWANSFDGGNTWNYLGLPEKPRM